MARANTQGAAFRFAIVATTAFLTLVDLFAAQAILPALTQAYRASPAAMSFAVNASTIGMAAGGLGVAIFGQRIDRRIGIFMSLGLLCIPTLALSTLPPLPLFTLLRIVQGVCMSSAFALTLAYLGERLDGRNAAVAFAAYITGNVASNLIGRLLSAGVADHLGLSANFEVFAALNIAGALLVYCTVPSTPRKMEAAPTMTGWRLLAPLLADAGFRVYYDADRHKLFRVSASDFHHAFGRQRRTSFRYASGDVGGIVGRAAGPAVAAGRDRACGAGGHGACRRRNFFRPGRRDRLR